MHRVTNRFCNPLYSRDCRMLKCCTRTVTLVVRSSSHRWCEIRQLTWNSVLSCQTCETNVLFWSTTPLFVAPQCSQLLVYYGDLAPKRFLLFLFCIVLLRNMASPLNFHPILSLEIWNNFLAVYTTSIGGHGLGYVASWSIQCIV